jgi:hypothetical protein
MPRTPMLIAAIACATLAACSKHEPAEQNTAAAMPTTNYLAQIEALPQGQREGVFLRAIRDAGQDCQGVTKSQSTQTGDGKPAWAATCADGSTYVLVLGQDGIMTVTNAASVRGTGG